MKTPKLLMSFAVFMALALFPGGADALNLSQTNLSLSVGQTSSITAYNVFGTLYISSNSNPNVATANIYGNTISVYGNNAGNTIITVCETSSSPCGTLYVTVGSGSFPGAATGVSVSSLSLFVGNAATVSSSAGGLYATSNSNPNIATASYSALPVGCYGNAQYSVVTGQPCFYQASASTSSLTISALSPGVTAITFCQTNTNVCSTINVVVSGSLASQTYPTYPTYPPYPPTYSGYISYAGTGGTCSITRVLKFGSSGSDVYCLQSYLYNRGYLRSQSSLTSYFDADTLNAVIAFQQDNYLVPDGVVGRMTRDRLY